MGHALDVRTTIPQATASRVVSHDSESGSPVTVVVPKAAVLLVDDHPASLAALKAVLEPLDLDLVSCSSGTDAIRRLSEQDFALILLDVQMPGMDGFKTAQLIGEGPRSRGTPIIFITGSGHPSQVFRGYSHGAVDYLVKPFDPNILRSKVSVFIELYLQKAKIKQLEKEARSEAQIANQLKDDFLAIVSHELRTPLTAILGWTRIIRGGKLDPERLTRGLEVIERSGRAQAAIIDDLLDVSRIIAGKLRLEIVDVDLLAVVATALDIVRPAAEAKGIDITCRLEVADPSFAGDPDRLQQIVYNLLSNAVKFTARGGHVAVTMTRTDSRIEISVADTGQGIDPAFLPHVFDRFRQADSTSSRRHGGLGLGLAIARYLVELHGGTIQVESGGENQGARFSVSLPVRTATFLTTERVALPPGASTARSPQILAGLRVLNVEGHADARELVATVLENAGARVVTVATTQEALASLSQDRPDVVLAEGPIDPDLLAAQKAALAGRRSS